MASNKKDLRRADLIVPYQEPATKAEGAEFGSTLSSTLPMAAVFMRNRYVGWAAVVFSIQNWLGESEDSRRNGTSGGIFTVGMSFMSLLVTYLPIFLPPPPGLNAGSATNAPAPAPVPVA